MSKGTSETAPLPEAPRPKRIRHYRHHRRWDPDPWAEPPPPAQISDPPAGPPPQIIAHLSEALPAIAAALGLEPLPPLPEPTPPLSWEADFRPSDFFARNPIFRFEEFAAAHEAAGRSSASAASILKHYVRQGRLRHAKRGLYCPPLFPDPWVLGSKLTRDAVIAYDGALSFHGFTELEYGMTIITREQLHYFVFNEVVYRGVRAPSEKGFSGTESHETPPSIIEVERSGQTLKVTTRERTLVDVLDRLDLGPRPAELWHLFKTAPGLDHAAMVMHAAKLGRRVTLARLGFFLEQLLGAQHLLVDLLRKSRPRTPTYFDRGDRRGEHLFERTWNLCIPVKLLALVRGTSH